MRRSFLALACALFILTLVHAAAEPTTYEIDKSHSDIGFKVRHLGVSWVRGSFQEYSGTVTFDPAAPEATQVDVVIDTNSIYTNSENRDNHLRGEDFFNVEAYPEITFHSTGIENFNGDSVDVIGDLTIRDVTKEVVLEVRDLTDEMTDSRGNRRRGATATVEIDRKDFNVSYNSVLDTGGLALGETVYVTLEIEMVVHAPEPAEGA